MLYAYLTPTTQDELSMRTLLVVLVLFDTSFLREAARGSSRLIRRGIVDSTPMHQRRTGAVPHIHTGPTIVAALRGTKREGGGNDWLFPVGSLLQLPLAAVTTRATRECEWLRIVDSATIAFMA